MNKLKLYALGLMALASTGLQAQQTPAGQMEKLGRGIVALPAASGSGNFVSWRFLGTDDEFHTTFDVMRNNAIIARDLYKTNYRDANGGSSSTYRIVTKVDGVPVDTTEAVQAWGQAYKKIVLDRPAGGSLNNASYTYSPNDCSVGDVDGDGEYEIILKWDPSNSQDNSKNGNTGNVYIDCYKLDGTKLWRIDLGRNIRAGAHYTQFMVYDFDGDGKAEVMMKTAPGSKDGQGNYVNQAATDAAIKSASNTKSWVVSGGRINGGQEYLTVFNGLTGAAIHTVAYWPNRNAKTTLSEEAGTFNWDDRSGKSDKGNYGNRGERYLAAVAHLDGPDQPAAGIFSRGYYTYAYVWAVGFDGEKLYTKWLHRSDSKTKYSVVKADGSSQEYTAPKSSAGEGRNTMYGNGNHNLSIADVDGDGKDEILWGSAALDDDGRLLYSVGFGHGDAIHLSDMDPNRPGLELFDIHEDKGTYAWDVHDARTGEIIAKGGPSGVDNGRGIASQLSATSHEFWFSSAEDRQQRSAVTGEVVTTAQTSLNFRMYWDATLQDQLLDGNTLDRWNGTSMVRSVTFYNLGPGSTCNDTKKTPNLSGDIMGDWREELILYSVTDEETCLAIYSTNIETEFRMPTLMHDHTYRMGICWQNTAYNQPPHLGYNLAEAMMPHLVNKDMWEIDGHVGDSVSVTSLVKYAKSVSLQASFDPNGTRKSRGVPEGFESKLYDSATKTLKVKGVPQLEGDYLFALQLTGIDGTKVNDTIVVHAAAAINGIVPNTIAEPMHTQPMYDLQGRQRQNGQRGLFIVRRGDKFVKVVK